LSKSTTESLGIIGSGSWGTALAKILTDGGHTIHWWMRSEAAVGQLASRGHNPHYLSSVHFSTERIRPTTDLPSLLHACDTVVFAVPSAYAESVLASVPQEVWRKKNIISAIKGILPETHLLLGDFLAKQYDFSLDRYVAITGPCHAEEVAGERLSYLTFSGLDDDLTSSAAALFRNDYIQTNHNHDIWGAQFAAVLKNIYAVGAGMAHGLDYGDNFLSVYITACYREMHRFLKKHFKKIHPSDEKPDFFTSAYLGDLLVTCYSLHSRNRAFGTMIGKGYSVRAATLEMNMVAEGYYASRGMQAITKPLKLKTPIADCIYTVLWEGTPARSAFKQLEAMIS
jgi:glycerol-3-phosphate dehydrogenase (NAD(P)+)